MSLANIVVLIIAVALMFWGKRRINEKNKAAAENIQKGTEFLDNNRNKEGVESTDSGLQYKNMVKGEGTENPSATDTVKVHYHGTLIDGSVFDSSVDRGQPISFGLNQVIPGWTEGLQLMVVGDKTRLFIPSSLAYGGRATGGIPGNSTLIFDVELLEIQKK